MNPGSGFDSSADCCFDPTDCDWTYSTWSCCTTENKCKEGDGDCDYDDQCQDGFVCGRDNCRTLRESLDLPFSEFDPIADCCKKAGKESEVLGIKTADYNGARMGYITISDTYHFLVIALRRVH